MNRIAGVYGIVDVSGTAALDELTLADAWLGAGVTVLQLRMKAASRDSVQAVLARLVPRCSAVCCLLIVNDHVDLAAAHDGVGVHLGQDDMDPVAARQILGPKRVIGWSTHTLAQVRATAAEPVDYIGYGPVFSAEGKHRAPSDTRRAMTPCGLGSLSDAVAAATVPVVAIGGIDARRLPFVLATGVAAVAMISAVAQSADPQRAARALAVACR